MIVWAALIRVLIVFVCLILNIRHCVWWICLKTVISIVFRVQNVSVWIWLNLNQKVVVYCLKHENPRVTCNKYYPSNLLILKSPNITLRKYTTILTKNIYLKKIYHNIDRRIGDNQQMADVDDDVQKKF